MRIKLNVPVVLFENYTVEIELDESELEPYPELQGLIEAIETGRQLTDEQAGLLWSLEETVDAVANKVPSHLSDHWELNESCGASDLDFKVID